MAGCIPTAQEGRATVKVDARIFLVLISLVVVALITHQLLGWDQYLPTWVMIWGVTGSIALQAYYFIMGRSHNAVLFTKRVVGLNHYNRPDGISPAMARYVYTRSVDSLALAATVIEMTAKGYLKLTVRNGILNVIRILQDQTTSPELTSEEKVILDAMFRQEDICQIGNSASAVAYSTLERLDRKVSSNMAVYDPEVKSAIKIGLIVCGLVSFFFWPLGILLQSDFFGISLFAVICAGVAFFYSLIKKPATQPILEDSFLRDIQDKLISTGNSFLSIVYLLVGAFGMIILILVTSPGLTQFIDAVFLSAVSGGREPFLAFNFFSWCFFFILMTSPSEEKILLFAHIDSFRNYLKLAEVRDVPSLTEGYLEDGEVHVTHEMADLVALGFAEGKTDLLASYFVEACDIRADT